MKKNGRNTGKRRDFHPSAESVWHLFDNVPPPSDDLESRIITHVMQITPVSVKTGTVKRSYTWVYRIAAMLLVAAGVSFWALYLNETKMPPVSISEAIQSAHVVFSTARGETEEFNLTENIYIQLNTESELRVLTENHSALPSSAKRLVYLKGEGYFNVNTADEGFEVITDAGVIGVIGTSFNVLARNDQVEVTVESGVVSLRGFPEDDIRDEVRIPSGHMSRKSRNLPALKPLPVEVSEYISWREGRFVFDQTPLSDVIKNLQRAYNVRIDLRDANLASIPVTGKFGQEPLVQILNEICWSANLRYLQEENRFIVYQPD
jgi:ferric-dicitrate binding protein FerR (iron transport regulator)